MKRTVDPTPSLTTYRLQFKPGELMCSGCTTRLKSTLKAVPETDPNSVKASFIAGTAEISTCSSLDTVLEAIRPLEPQVINNASLEPDSTPFDELNRPGQEKKYLWRSLIATLFGLPLFILEMLSLIPGPSMLIGQLILIAITALSAGVMLYCGWDIYKNAFSKLRKGQSNMNTLVSLGSLLALAYSLLMIFAPAVLPMLPGLHMSICAGVLILAIVNFGSYLKERAKRKATAELPKMREQYRQLQPSRAYKVDKVNRSKIEIYFAQIKKGDLILVEASQYFPVDGKIITENSKILVDERSMTGEKTARPHSTGDEIQSGTLYQSNSETQHLLIEASCDGENGRFHNSMLKVAAAMLDEPENDSIDRFITWFTPAVIAIAIAAGLAWFFLASTPAMSLAVFLAVLLCACPCALGLAAPIAYSTAVNTAFKHGIYIRQAAALDALAKVKAVAFDLTGTLTEGEMSVQACSEAIDDEILQLVASIEQHSKSKHPIAGAILKANALALVNTSEVTSDAAGISGLANDKRIHIGASNWLNAQGLAVPEELKEKAKRHETDVNKIFTVSYVAVDRVVVGYILTTQKLRDDAAVTIQSLNQQGIETILLTGAQREMAERVATHLKIKTVKAEQSAQNKKDYLEARHQNLAFLGDDPNDFLALQARNVVGLSIHPQAPAAALAAINLSGSVNDVLKVVALAKSTRSNIHFSLGFMLVYNLVSIALAAGLFFIFTGMLLNPILASALMGISSLTVVLSGMSLRYFIERKLNPKLTLRKRISNYWKETSTLNKVIQLGLSLFSLLLVSTVIANLTLGFSWMVIFNSMILACTCCTGIVGLLSAVGLIGLGLNLLIIAGRFAYHYLKSSPKDSNNKPPPPALRSVSDRGTTLSGRHSEKASTIGQKTQGSRWHLNLFAPGKNSQEQSILATAAQHEYLRPSQAKLAY